MNTPTLRRIEEELGISGRMISWSKSGYCKMHEKNLVIFNANIIIIDPKTKKSEKVWHGDIDVTLDEKSILKIADKIGAEVLVLREQDARFSNEKKPLIDRFVYRSSDKTLGKMEIEFYERKRGKIKKK